MTRTQEHSSVFEFLKGEGERMGEQKLERTPPPRGEGKSAQDEEEVFMKGTRGYLAEGTALTMAEGP